MGAPNKLLVVDLSSNNPPPNLKAYWDAGYRVLIVKVTEGTGYVWSQSHALAAEWHKMGGRFRRLSRRVGGIVGHYHFGSPGSGKAEAVWFLNHVTNDLAAGDFLVYDAERAGIKAAQINEFIDTIDDHAAHAGKTKVGRLLRRAFRRSMIYGSPGFLIPNHITGHRGWRLWEAEYGPHADPVPGFKGHVMWQYTSGATVAGMGGRVDLSRMSRRVIRPPLHPGDHNFAVLDVAIALRHHGYRGFVVNAKYGVGKQRAVRKLKAAHGLKSTAVCGHRVHQLLGLAAVHKPHKPQHHGKSPRAAVAVRDAHVHVNVDPVDDSPLLPAPSSVDAFLHPVWTSPSWWTSTIVLVSSLVAGFAALFGHPIAGHLPDATVAAASVVAASIAGAVIAVTRSQVRTAAIQASAATHVAHADMARTLMAAAVTSAASPPPATDPGPATAKPGGRKTTARKAAAR